ncbi:MAG: PHP domain-containing protein [Candidatus Pseudobacter hemicellulosilyticus]|uniref:DNA-directed DNA polymerase n=1 Tax=Candidatus Pseudobacter hemicellulosilyticus TaxID=3121375 RepID=A0AAJ6BJZ9_9BACT|nr:MAG: PHP domain-containing protein [Pseudobacter sp.]
MYLNCKTYFSFQYGTFSTEELVKAGVETGATALALTNINNTCDAWDFVAQCKEQGIKPILGTEVRNGDKLLYILLAANNRGFAWINAFLSDHLCQHKPFPEQAGPHPFFTDSWDGYVIYPLGAKDPGQLLPNELIGLLPAELTKLLGLASSVRDKFVVRQPVTVQDKKYHNVHRLLRAINNNVLLSKLPAASVCTPAETFLPLTALFDNFRHHPYIITNTFRIMDSCSIELEFGSDKNKKFFTASKKDDVQLLKKLAYDGLNERYGHNPIALERMHKELQVIDQMGFTAYFLITWDFIRYAANRGFHHVGRGSGANSIVAYCLHITDVDPIELNLYFERFLNAERTSPPDFDIDFSWLERNEIIDYIFKRYGEQHVALVGCYTTFQYNATIRELGKVFGLPAAEIDQLGNRGGATDKYQQLVLQYGKLLTNFPNHLSIHAGGMLISEAPIHQYTATWMPPKGFATTQIDMYLAEDVGLYKYDVLSQRGLGHIKETIRLVKENRQQHIDITTVQQFKEDPAVQQQLRQVNTIGCFYIESPAMRQLLSKLRCPDYGTLVVASSIIRPGVASSGMMREYIQRYHQPEKVQYLHPIMEELLKETFGVMVFQEDVIKIAHFFGGLAMGEADVLRRAMSGKYRSHNRFTQMKEQFFSNCRSQGHPDELTAEVWRQMESFAGYSFCKAHSASFAVESFQDLYLKTYYPLEFMVGVINNFGGFYSTELYFLELRKAGASIHLPCVNNSEYLTCIRGTEVYVGLVHLKGLEKKAAEKLLRDRQLRGPFQHLQDCIERTGLPAEQLNILVSIGAFRFTGQPKKKLLWQANFLQQHNNTREYQHRLFREPPKSFQLPELVDHPLDDIYDEIELLGFPLRNPFELVDEDPALYVPAVNLSKYLGQSVSVLGYFIDYKVVPTKNQQVMSFGAFLDAQLNWVDTVHFPDSLQRWPLKGKGFYKLKGKVVEDFGICSVEVSSLAKVGYRERKYANL